MSLETVTKEPMVNVLVPLVAFRCLACGKDGLDDITGCPIHETRQLEGYDTGEHEPQEVPIRCNEHWHYQEVR